MANEQFGETAERVLKAENPRTAIVMALCAVQSAGHLRERDLQNRIDELTAVLRDMKSAAQTALFGG